MLCCRTKSDIIAPIQKYLQTNVEHLIKSYIDAVDFDVKTIPATHQIVPENLTKAERPALQYLKKG